MARRFKAPHAALSLGAAGLAAFFFAWLGRMGKGPTRPPVRLTARPATKPVFLFQEPKETYVPARAAFSRSKELASGRQARAYRLADELVAARYEGPDPVQAYKRLHHHWLKMIDAYGKLDHFRAHLRLKVAFLEQNLARYLGKNETLGPRRLKRRKHGWHWANQGAYESRLALAAYLPSEVGSSNALETEAGSSYSFELLLPSRPVLELGIGFIPFAGADPAGVSFSVEVELLDLQSSNGKEGGRRKVVFKEQLTKAQFLRWHERSIPLHLFAGRRVRLVMRTMGRDGAGLWMDPCIWGSQGPSSDNVLMIVVDCMRPDAVRALGGEHAITPEMDALVGSGTRFTRFFTSGSWTRASMVSFFSANYPSSVGLETDSFSLPLDRRKAFYTMRPPQLPDHLEQQGYATGAVINNYFALPYAPTGVDHGFPYMNDIRHNRLDNEVINRTAVEFMRRNRNRRFFLYLHYESVHNYPHRPFIHRRLPLPLHVRMDGRYREYLAGARRIDRYLGDLIRAVKKLGLHRNTLVILTSDHGEVFDRKHDHVVPGFMFMRMRYQHARSVWDEVTHIPMVWVRPNRIPSGRTVPVQLPSIDLAPSILEFLGLPSMEPVSGRSFLSLVQEGSNPADPSDTTAAFRARPHPKDRPVYSEGLAVRGLRAFGKKYIFRKPKAEAFLFQDRLLHRKEELFDLVADPCETNNKAVGDPVSLRRMREMMEGLRKASAFSSFNRYYQKASPIYHLRFCGNGEADRLTGRVRVMEGRHGLVVAGAAGRLRLTPSADDSKELALEVDTHEGCSGVDWVAAPDSTLRLALGLNGRPIQPEEIRVGRFGLSLLKKPLLDQTTSTLLMAYKPPELSALRRNGSVEIFLWQDFMSTGAWMDSAAAQRDRASAQLVRFNLEQGGYVKRGRKPSR